MIYVLVEGDNVTYPYSVTDFRLANPQVSMRANPPAETLAEFGMFPVEQTERPDHDPITQDLARGVEKQGDTWREVWTVANAAPEDVTIRFAERKREKWERVKACRDSIIDDSFGAKTTAAQANALALGAAIQAAKDNAALAAIDIGAGWP